MAKKNGSIAQNEAVAYNAAGVAELLKKMVSHPDEFKKKKIGDYLAMHASDIKAALGVGVGVAEIAKQFRDLDLLDVSDAVMRKFVKENALAPAVAKKSGAVTAAATPAAKPVAAAVKPAAPVAAKSA